MADYKRIVKNVLFVALVPTVIVAGYYGYKAFKDYSNKKKEGEEEDENKESEPEKDNEVKLNVISESKEENKEEAKVIPITRGLTYIPKEENEDTVEEMKLSKKA